MQNIEMLYHRELETQRITLNGMDSVGDIKFTQSGKAATTAFSTLDATNKTTNWQENFDAMLKVQCTYDNTNHFEEQNYEDPDYILDGMWSSGTDQVDCFCGDRCMERQTRIFHKYHTRRYIDALKYNFICLAVKGTAYTGRVQVLYRWQDQRNRQRRDWIHFNGMFEPSADWQHFCLDWKTLGQNSTLSWIARDDQMKDGSYLKIEDFILQVTDGDEYYYNDEITIGENPVEITRSQPKVPSSRVVVDGVSVAPADDAEGAWDIEINPSSCNVEEDDFGLFGIEGAEIQGLTYPTSQDYPDALDLAQAKVEAETTYLATHDTATFTAAAWGAGTVTVERKMRGMRTLAGDYTLSWRGKTTPALPFYMTNKQLKNVLEGEFGMTGVKVFYWGRRCYWQSFKIEFGRSVLGGGVEKMVLNRDNIITNGTTWTRFRAKGHTDGGHQVLSPGGDFFRLKEAEPTVEVRVNGFLSSCTGNCSFFHTEEDTPEVTTLSALNSGLLTITGTNLAENTNDVEVKVGEMDCETLTASLTEVTCQLEGGPTGTHPLTLVVKSKGLARQPTPLSHTVTLTILSSSPEAGSVGGGTPITVTGTGFPGTMDAWQGGSVSLGGVACTVIETSYTEFVCITGAQTGNRRKRSASSFEISINGASASGGGFNYDASLTPSLISISPTSSSPLGGGVLTITGSALGAKWGKVIIGSAPCSLLTWGDTEVTCTLPSNQHGQHPVLVEVPDQGYADITGVPTFDVTFKVTDVTPRVGSTMGGTMVRIEGAGFGNCSLDTEEAITVSFGNKMTCNIKDCIDTQIICETQRVAKVVSTNNGGRHPRYGLGYVWNPQEIIIQPGDTVQWQWSLTTSSGETGINVHQVNRADTNEWNGNGFSSGEKKASGVFREKFAAPGTYHFSSDSVFGVGLYMPGTVVVQGETEDTVLDLMVNMADIPAFHDMVTGGSGNTFTKPGCTEVDFFTCANAPTSSDVFQFKAATCLTPEVTDVTISDQPAITSSSSNTPFDGYQGTSLTITGTGFAATSCQNTVRIGDAGHLCSITSASATSISCTINGNPGGDIPPMESMKTQVLGLNVMNQGEALFNTWFDKVKFRLYPKITTASLSEGSWAGGSIFVLSGSGLIPQGGAEATLVIFGDETIGQKSCAIVDIAFDYISCLVPDFTDIKGGQTDMVVPVSLQMGYLSEAPTMDSNLTFTFRESLMATADAMQPTTVEGTTEITITGTNFGSSTDEIQIFARTKVSSVSGVVTISGRRRKRSVVVEQNINEESSPELHKWWYQKSVTFGADNKPKFRSIYFV